MRNSRDGSAGATANPDEADRTAWASTGALLAASLLWPLSFGLIKRYLPGVDVFAVALTRLTLSCLLFLPFLRLKDLPRGAAACLPAIGAVQYGMMYAFYIAAFRFLPAYQVALFTIFTPLYVTLIHDIRGRCFHRRFLLAAMLAVAGTALVLGVEPAFSGAWTGFLLVQGSNVCFAAGQLAYREWKRPFPRVSDHRLFALLYAGGALICLPPVLCQGVAASFPSLSAAQAWVLLYLGLIPSGLAFYLWNVGAARANPGTLAVLNNAKIPLAVFYATTLFDETASLWRLAAGGIAIAAAALVCEWGGRRA